MDITQCDESIAPKRIMTNVEVDGQDQNEMVCTHRCYHGKINDEERLQRSVVNMVDFCLVYRTGYDIFCESLEWQALHLRNGLYNRQMY